MIRARVRESERKGERERKISKKDRKGMRDRGKRQRKER